MEERVNYQKDFSTVQKRNIMPALLNFSPFTFGATGIPYAFEHSDSVGKGIVILLGLFSIITWTIMLEKGLSLRKAGKDCRSFMKRFREKRNPFVFFDRIEEEPSPTARVCESGYQRIRSLGAISPTGGHRALTTLELEIVKGTLEEAVAEQILILEKKIIFIATAVTISPFLGLFGTVWGIMLAFTDLAIMGKADIQTLAPGVSGALLTTVLGLVVAIPSVVGYNIITNQIKETIVQMDNFVEEFCLKLKVEQLSAEEVPAEEADEVSGGKMVFRNESF